MTLKKSEYVACEAIDTMLRHKVALGLQDLPDDAQKEEEHSFQYLHEQINEMFAIKAAGLTHHDGACAAFHKVHNYKYVTDPTFEASVNEEMQAQGIPAEEREQVLKYIPAIINEIRKGNDWCERDAGYHPNLKEILKAAQPGISKSTIKEDEFGIEGDRPPQLIFGSHFIVDIDDRKTFEKIIQHIGADWFQPVEPGDHEVCRTLSVAEFVHYLRTSTDLLPPLKEDIPEPTHGEAPVSILARAMGIGSLTKP